MTCAIGVVDNQGTIWLGADSCASSSETKRIYSIKKIFNNHDFLIAYAGSFRPGQLLQYRFDPPKQSKNMDDDTFINTIFIDAVRKCFESNGYNIETLDKKLLDNDFLIGYKSNIYTINNDYHISKMVKNYTAIGSGADVALGSLFSTEDNENIQLRIEIALNAAEYFCPGVAPPYYIMKS
jgi:ATP-dependent protease HslVU (ClpYQ) peptidase subunit